MELVFRLVKKVAYFEVLKNKNAIIIDSMSDLNFVEENEFHVKSRRLLGEPTTPSMIKFLLRTGVAKTEKQALFILLILVALIIIATIWLAKIKFGSPEQDHLEDRFGNRYTLEEYFSLLGEGKDPLSPDFRP